MEKELIKELTDIKKELQDIRSILEPKKKVLSFSFDLLRKVDPIELLKINTLNELREFYGLAKIDGGDIKIVD